MLFRNLRVHQIFGANTEVGKTVFSTALCRTSAQLGEASHYLKPVGTGGYGDDWCVMLVWFLKTNASLQARLIFRKGHKDSLLALLR